MNSWMVQTGLSWHVISSSGETRKKSTISLPTELTNFIEFKPFYTAQLTVLFYN